MTALETVGAELRGLKADLQRAGGAPAEAPPAGDAIKRLAERLDRLPDQMRSAVRAALHPSPAPEQPQAGGGRPTLGAVARPSPDATP